MGDRPTTGRGGGPHGVADARARRGSCRRTRPGWTAAAPPGRRPRWRRGRPAPGVADVLPHDEDRLGRHLGAQAHPVLLEVHDPAPAGAVGVGDRDVRLDPVVAHRQQPDPVAVERLEPAAAQRLGDLREARSRPPASGCARGGWRCRGRPGRTTSARRRTPPARSSRSTSPRCRPHPRSTSIPSPRVYITVSRSGQTFSPWIHQSSAVLATTVTSVSADPPGTSAGAQAVEEALDEPGPAHTSREDGDMAERPGSPGRG